MHPFLTRTIITDNPTEAAWKSIADSRDPKVGLSKFFKTNAYEGINDIKLRQGNVFIHTPSGQIVRVARSALMRGVDEAPGIPSDADKINFSDNLQHAFATHKIHPDYFHMLTKLIWACGQKMASPMTTAVSAQFFAKVKDEDTETMREGMVSKPEISQGEWHVTPQFSKAGARLAPTVEHISRAEYFSALVPKTNKYLYNTATGEVLWIGANNQPKTYEGLKPLLATEHRIRVEFGKGSQDPVALRTLNATIETYSPHIALKFSPTIAASFWMQLGIRSCASLEKIPVRFIREIGTFLREKLAHDTKILPSVYQEYKSVYPEVYPPQEAQWISIKSTPVLLGAPEAVVEPGVKVSLASLVNRGKKRKVLQTTEQDVLLSGPEQDVHPPSLKGG